MMKGTHRDGYSFRDVAIKTTDKWLELQRKESGAEGLWRIHDDLYDVTEWMNHHPGGKEWLEITKGTDITEAFEAHHISERAAGMLPKFHIRKAISPRHSLLTFSEDGFYRTLKKRVRDKLRDVPKTESVKSKLILDFLLASSFLSAIYAVQNIYMVAMAGLMLTWTCIAAHNFFHQKDNWRMYTFNLTFMNYREWRISHALSHHLYPNTLVDMECSMAEPLLIWFPEPKGFRKYSAFISSPIVYAGVYFTQFALRICSAVRFLKLNIPLWQELIPFSLPIVMLITTGASPMTVFITWISILITSSFIFGVIGINAAHHHPRIYHHGDQTRSDMDFGIFQLDAVMDRTDITGSRFLVLTNFGDHGLHHLFPMLDHGYLPHLYPVLEETCKEFGIILRFTTQWDLMKGQFRQLFKTEPNTRYPGS